MERTSVIIMVLTEEIKKVTVALDKRIASKRNTGFACPICTNNNFIVAEGYTHRDLNKNLQQRTIGGENVPSITAVCSNCGYIFDFSLGVLGFLKPPEEKKEVKNEEEKPK